ncbi:Gfo/Idh/MocA family protein [Mycolicibacterium pallens]|uniref:Gfo/Idh/MocA family oxidoreductase n=1 Tax=Mycolicibacterium pallens TaxID=370524 RepID=A0ABX8VJ88_9MYCO|nr:Gfo/Idh/MocA family oxidoreductase [Mycolicibacterium pallens]QYL17874.1 Gfo/Idh/MocA family oxidoreductase [Mycolicibacterium pallens]
MFRYDVVGCGEVVAQEHGLVLSRLQSEGVLEVRACIDTSTDRAARMAKRLHSRAVESVDRAGVSGADAALIATPPEFHTDLALQYLLAGRSVLIEKPFAPTLSDAQRLVNAASAGKARVLVGHMRRLYPAIQVAREIVRSGMLGEIYRAEAREGSRWEWGAASSYVVKSAYGGVLYDTGAHVLDTLLFLLDLDSPDAVPTVTVESVMRNREAEPSHDFEAQFRLSREDMELPVDFRVSRTCALPRSVVLHAERASLVVGGAFAQQPTVVSGGRPMRVDLPLTIQRPQDPSGCYRLENEAIVNPSSHADVSQLLDGSRFLTLAGLFDALVTA